MALLSRITCRQCGEVAEVNHSPSDWPEICHACASKNAASERGLHFAELDKLPLEERLRRVEEWIYDYSPQWVPPPRF